MSRIVFAWEAGSGLGHILPHLSLIRALQSSGHEVVFIARDLGRSIGFLSPLGVKCFQAPLRFEPIHGMVQVPCTYAHILHNMGFDCPHLLWGMTQGWRTLLKEIRPSLVILDHAPTALLACRTIGIKALLTGTGFVIPPIVSPFPNLRSRAHKDLAELENDESRILHVVNRVLKHFKYKALETLCELFAGIPTCLTSFPELDPYSAEREETRYYGVSTDGYGDAPQWPGHDGFKIFAYLKPSPLLPSLLGAISQQQFTSLVYIGQKNQHFAKMYTSPKLRFVPRPLNLANIGTQADAVVLNGTHNTTAQMLLAGKPIINHPLYLEQEITANSVKSLGAGEVYREKHAQSATSLLNDLVTCKNKKHNAFLFSRKHSNLYGGKRKDSINNFIIEKLNM